MNPETLKVIAKLAHIDVDNDFDSVHEKINATIANIDKLKKVDTTNVDVFQHTFNTQQRVREDILDNKNHIAELAKLAPEFSDDTYQVPNVLPQTGDKHA